MKLDITVLLRELLKVKETLTLHWIVKDIYAFIGNIDPEKYQVAVPSKTHATNLSKGTEGVRAKIASAVLDGEVIAKMPNHIKNSLLIKLDKTKIRSLVDNLLIIVRTDSSIGITAKERMEEYAKSPADTHKFLAEIFLYVLENGKKEKKKKKRILDDTSTAVSTAPQNALTATKKLGLSVEESEGQLTAFYLPRRLSILQPDGKRRYINETDILHNIEGIKCLIAPGGNGKSTLAAHLSLKYNKCKLASCLCLCHAFDEKTDVQELLGIDNKAFIFDGMDEIPSIHLKNSMLGIVARHALRETSNILFTTRTDQDVSVISEYFNCPVTTIYLDDFSPEDCERYVEHYLGDRANNFWYGFQYIELSTYECFMTDFLFSPFYLKYLVQFYQKEGTLPDSKNALLEIAVDLFIKKESILDTANYSDLVRRFTIDELKNILKYFAKIKYETAFAGDDLALLRTMLKKDFQFPTTYAERIYLFLHDRGLLINGMFEHRLIQEFLVALCFFDHCNEAVISIESIRELFSHYHDSYWQEVIKLFLGICEDRLAEMRKEQLYTAILDTGLISDYTLIFDFFSESTNRYYCIPQIKLFLKDILSKSITGYYTSDSPLFFYVPKYRFGPELNDLLDDEDFQENECAHTLINDVLSFYDSIP